MTLNDLGNIGELVGGLAVVVSLLYLAVQIRHSGKIARFDAHRSLSHGMASWLGNIASDPELYRVWTIMTNNPSAATEDDRERFGMLLYQAFTTFSDAERFAQMDPDLETRFRSYLDRLLRYEAVQGWWSRQGPHYAPRFQKFVGARLERIRAQQANTVGTAV
ncbi:MAG: hypothetical protein R3288_07070 [Woeseiaceae bacterium]|nr:hypothetical protein [Woeseiaceae bacterium]